MQLYPSFDEFRALAAATLAPARPSGAAAAPAAPGAPPATGWVVPVWREFLFDVDTAVTAYHKLAEPPFGFLLESVVGGEQWARYTFLGTRPSGAWRLKDGEVSWWTPETGWKAIEPLGDPLSDLDERLRARRPAEVPGLPRLWGGAVGYFTYDVVRLIERLPSPPFDDLGIPDGLFLFTDVVLAIDNLRGRAIAIAAVPIDAGMEASDLRRAYDGAAERTTVLIARLEQEPAPKPLALKPEPEQDPSFTSSTTRAQFEAGVERIREYIRAGDAFQVVLSQRLGMQLRASPFDLYRGLRSLNPSPYLYYLELDGLTLVGSSPEVLVRLEGGVVTVRPIAGTRRRGRNAEEDCALAAELLTDEKELAEHRMLVDLGRNDVGRVAEYGSVRVPDLIVVERYSHVMHLVSQVEGKLRAGLSAIDAFRACFPAGTVSGAPKIRAMEIIDELEPVKRGTYAGAVGHFGWGGTSMDTAITIRTVAVTGGQAYVQAGAGIVLDSNPATEYEESLSKARALLRAAAMVGR